MKSNVFYSLMILLGLSGVGHAQQYIIFERQTTINQKEIAKGIFLSQNEVMVKSKDTTLSIFNLYFSSDTSDLYPLNSKNIADNSKSISFLNNDIVITAVPLVKPGEQLQYKEISSAELAGFEIIKPLEILKKELPDLYIHATQRYYTMPSLKTLNYRLIIKDKGKYYFVKQPVLLVTNLVCSDLWYFPTEFKDGVLNASTKFSKSYRMPDFKKMAAETGSSFLWKELQNRIYLGDVDKNSDFGIPVYSYWEFLSGDAISILSEKNNLKQYQPGLGSFTLLPKFGIVNCTLDYYLKNKLPEYPGSSPKSTFDIISVNNLSPKAIGEVYNKTRSKVINAVE